MSSALIYVLAFVVALGILITVHEFGHFWVARRLGVKVLRFSVGFGKPLLARRSRDGETEYVLAALPLGGYVKMLDEREAPVAEAEKARAFNNKSVGTRIAVVSAGPLFNLLFAIAAFWVIFMVGVPGVAPVIGYVEPGSPAAQAGLQSDSRIVAVNSQPTSTWETARLALFEAALTRKPIALTTRTAAGDTQVRTLSLAPGSGPLEPQGLFDAVGFQPWQPVAEVAGVQAGSAADRAGFQAGDRIVALDGKPVRYWGEWVRYVRERPEQQIDVTVQRDDGTRASAVAPGGP